MPRIFIVDQRQVPDPAPELPVDDPKAPMDIKRSLAVFFPELNSSTHSERVEGETTYVEFRRTVGTKGLPTPTPEAVDALIKLAQDIVVRYKPSGTKVFCWLCRTEGEHSPGCLYPNAVAALALTKDKLEG